MSTPYRTPNVRLPSTPNPTPATSYLKRPINLKPPIHNPYDKFTASEFNAWVSDLKGALRKALGQEDEASRATEEEEVELELEDSFAEYKTRRSAKGKGRDPREGPGLAAGVNWVSHVADTPSEDAATDDEVANLERESEEEEEEEEEEEDDEDRRPVLVTLNGEGSSGQPIELLSEDEDRVSPQPSKHHADDDDLYEWSDQEERSTPDIADPWNGPRTYAEDFYAGDDSRGASALAPEEDEEGGLVLTPDIGAEDEIIDVDADEDDERQDFYPAYVWLSSKDDGEQDGEEDTEFTRDGTPQIADPWEGPRMYMEDFYAGGDRIDRGALSDPSNLTPRYEESEVIELASDDDETDTSQGGPFSDAYTNAMNASHLREHEITEGPQSHRDFAFQVLQAHEDSVRQETPFLLPEMGSYSHKPAPASLPRARSKTPSIAPNGHVDWSWPPAFPIDGATLSADASEAVGELQIPEHPEQDRGQQPPGVDADAVAESAAEAAVSAAAPENGGEAAQAIAAEIEANLRKFDETVIQAALDAANASAAETEAMEAMVDFGAENVGADGMMDEEHDEAFDRATQESALASFEALIDAQNAEILDAAETSDESAVAVAAELQIDEEPREVEIAPEQNGAEYAVEEQDVDEQEVDELEGDDVVSVSASEYAARASQAREYTVEELRSEPRCSEVPEESLSIDASLAEDVEKSSEQAAEVDATQVKIAIAESHLETSSDKDQIDIAPTSPQTVPEERTVEELEATTEAAASSIDVVVFGDVSVDSTQDNFPEQPEETAEPSLIPDRTQEVPSTEVDADTSTIEAVPLHDLPELEVSLHDEPPARLQAEQVELAPASSPSRIPAGVPLPVMASPEVPDPASVGHTPGTVTPMTNIPPIMAGPALSSAGLFTPLGERSMGTTPEPDGNEESLQVPAEHNVAQVVDATPVQPIEGDMDENNISGFATVSEEPSVTTKPSDTEPITQCIAEEPETSRIVSPQENVASDLADADSSMEHSTTQSVNLHHPSQPMLHADPYPYSLSTPTLETSMTGFFDPQPTTSVSNEDPNIIGHDSDLDDLELTYPEARSVSPEVDRPIQGGPAYEAPIYRYPPLYIEDMPHLRLVHTGTAQPDANSLVLVDNNGQAESDSEPSKLASPVATVSPGALAEEEEEDLPKPEEEEESGPEDSPVMDYLPPPTLKPVESSQTAKASESGETPPKENGLSQAYAEKAQSQDDHIESVPDSSAAEMDIASIANEAASLNNNGEVNGSTGLLKRKRDSLAPLQLPDPVGDVKTGAADANGTAAPASKKPRKSKGNGRTKITVKPDPDAVSEAGSSGSVASVAAQVLASSSRVPSRASSVASEPSPTVPKSSGFKIRIKPLQQQTDRVFHHHGRKPKITPLPSITRSRPKLQRQRKSQKQPKAEAQAETEDAHLSQPSSKVQLTPKTEILSSAKPTPEAESSPMPKSESKPELLPSRPTPPFDVESPSLPPAPPTSPVKKPEPSQPAVLEADSAPQSPSLKSPESQYSSPVTRSHCLYHVISIPRKEDGPRITFMVPGCSLLDKDLITEEAIIDIREATREDEGRAVHDIETLGFDDDLLVVLKALVSGEQHSIFYLPSASEDPSFLNNNRQHFSEASNKGGSSQSTPVSARRKRAPRESVNGGSADHNGRSHTREAASNPASVDGDVVDSRNGSPSGTAESRSEGSSPDSRTADSFGEEDELDQSRLPPKKRKYLSHEGSLTSRPHDAADNDQGPSASASGSHHRDGFEPQLKSVASHRLKPRRSKRLSVDAAAYKPDESSPDDEQEQSTTRRHKRKRLSGRRSTKRGHDTANGVDDSGDRSVKKSRVEEVVSSGKNSDAGSPSS